MIEDKVIALMVWVLVVIIIIGTLIIKADKEGKMILIIVGLISILTMIKAL